MNGSPQRYKKTTTLVDELRFELHKGRQYGDLHHCKKCLLHLAYLNETSPVEEQELAELLIQPYHVYNDYYGISEPTTLAGQGKYSIKEKKYPKTSPYATKKYRRTEEEEKSSDKRIREHQKRATYGWPY